MKTSTCCLVGKLQFEAMLSHLNIEYLCFHNLAKTRDYTIQVFCDLAVVRLASPST